jgi:hypothetical protein
MTVDEFDPLITSVARQASTGQVLRLPWHTRSIPLGSFFNTKTASTSKVDPFSRDSAFDTESVRKSHINFEPFDGDASYKSSESTSSSTSADHLSVGVGVGISCFVVSASVSCQYDRHVMENNDVGASLFIYWPCRVKRTNRTLIPGFKNISYDNLPSWVRHLLKAPETIRSRLANPQVQWRIICLQTEMG